jgi:hypothetical protein
MNQALARLSPLERRFVVGVLVVVFVVMNLWWVRPHFGDWARTQARRETARKMLKNYVTVTNGIPKLEAEVAKLESESAPVPPEDQARDFALAIQSQAVQSHVNMMGSPRSTTRSNLFFVEQTQVIPIQANEKNLVEFLYKLGTNSSMIRARDFSLGPDAPRYLLSGNITLVASYQKNPPARPASSPTKAGTSRGAKSSTQIIKPKK